MSNISELATAGAELIENMTLRETEEQLRALYTRYYREITGKEPELGAADPLNLLIKAFAAMEYQTMQYADTKGRMELLKTSTGEALDALGALVGVSRKEPTPGHGHGTLYPVRGPGDGDGHPGGDTG